MPIRPQGTVSCRCYWCKQIFSTPIEVYRTTEGRASMSHPNEAGVPVATCPTCKKERTTAEEKSDVNAG